jgi:hypothetical protein
MRIEMKNRFQTNRFRTVWLLSISLALLVVMTGCARVATTDIEPPGAYNLAVTDVPIAPIEEVSSGAAAFTVDSPYLVWEGEPGKSRVLLVTWTDWAGCVNRVGSEINLECFYWVTTVPEVLEFIRQTDLWSTDMTLMLEQQYGFPFVSDKRYCVYMWVDPRDVSSLSAIAETDGDTVVDGSNPDGERIFDQFLVRVGAKVKVVSAIKTEQYRTSQKPYHETWV